MPVTSTAQTKSAAVRARLSHPVIDSDGHTIEFAPAVNDYLKQIAGPELLSRFGKVSAEAAILCHQITHFLLVAHHLLLTGIGACADIASAQPSRGVNTEVHHGN